MTEGKKAKFLDVKQIGNRLKFVLGDGQNLTFDTERPDAAIRERAMMHGFNQKIRDAAAGFSKDRDYDGAFEAMGKVIDGLYANEWNRKGGQPGLVMADLATALARFKNVPEERAWAAVERATAEQRTAWAKNATIERFMLEAKLARLAAAAETAPDDLDIDFGDNEDEAPDGTGSGDGA